jgi:hypothetical protein
MFVASLQTAPEQRFRAGASMPLIKQLAAQAGLAADDLSKSIVASLQTASDPRALKV